MCVCGWPPVTIVLLLLAPSLHRRCHLAVRSQAALSGCLALPRALCTLFVLNEVLPPQQACCLSQTAFPNCHEGAHVMFITFRMTLAVQPRGAAQFANRQCISMSTLWTGTTGHKHYAANSKSLFVTFWPVQSRRHTVLMNGATRHLQVK